MQSKQEIMINFEKEFITETPICHVCLRGKLSIDNKLTTNVPYFTYRWTSYWCSHAWCKTTRITASWVVSGTRKKTTTLTMISWLVLSPQWTLVRIPVIIINWDKCYLSHKCSILLKEKEPTESTYWWRGACELGLDTGGISVGSLAAYRFLQAQ